MDTEVITAHAYRVVIDDRISTLWRYRQWWRTHRWAEYPLRRVELDIELRALVRLARKARDLSRPAIERADPVTAADYHDWQAAYVEPAALR